MSTHYHLVVLDTQGLLPNLLRDVNRSIANVVKARYRTSGAVFEQEPSKVKLHGAKAIVDKIAYVLVNRIAAAAVRARLELRSRCGRNGRRAVAEVLDHRPRPRWPVQVGLSPRRPK